MKSEPFRLADADRTIPVPPDGVTEKLLWPSLLNLVDDMMVQLMDSLSSVPQDARHLRLSITVGAIGERRTNESSTSIMQPGQPSPMSPSVPASYKLRSGVRIPGSVMGAVRQHRSERDSSPTQLSRAGSPYHEFEDKVDPDGNCNHPGCRMPRNAFQHQLVEEG